MKLPKYVFARANSYYWQRFYPKSVQHLAPAKKFTMALAVKAGASPTDIAREALRAADAFDLDVARLSNSSWDGVLQSGADALSSKVLRSNGLSAGDLAQGSNVREIIEAVVRDAYRATQGREIADGELKTLMAQFVEKMATTGASEMVPGTGEIDQAVRRRMVKQITSRPSSAPETLTQLWVPYCRYRGHTMDMAQKSYRKLLAEWEAVLSYTGEHTLTGRDTAREINRGVKERIDDMIARGVKATSAVRSVATSLACFRWAADEYDLDWRIKQPRVPAEDSTQRHSASRSELITIAGQLVAWNDIQAVIGIAACHGVIPSELAHCDYSGLSNSIPYILIPPSKTKHRKRVVPIAWGVDAFRKNIEEAVNYCQKRADPAATFNKRLRKNVFNSPTEVTLYSLRHGCRNLFVLSGASTGIMQACLGWAGGQQGMHLHYGSDGVESSEWLVALDEASRKAHDPIIQALCESD